MLLFLFTLADLCVLIVTILTHFNIIASMVPLALAACYMFFKGLIFWGNLPSFVDMTIGVYLALMVLGVRWAVTIVVVIWLANKLVAAVLG